MEHLTQLLKEVAQELEKNIVTIESVLTTTSDRNISDILTEIRATVGVTIVSSMIPTKSVGRGVQLSHIKIKFLPLRNIPRKVYLLRLHQEIMKISGVIKTRFVKVHAHTGKYQGTAPLSV